MNSKENKSALVFEESIMSVLKHYCLDNNKKIYTEGEMNSYKYFDGYAPNGVFDNIPTIIEIKYTNNQKLFSQTLSYVYKKYNESPKLFNIEKNDYIVTSKKVKFLYISLLDEEQVQNINKSIETKKYENFIFDVLPIDKILELLYLYPVEATRLIDLIPSSGKSKEIIKMITREAIELETKATEKDIKKKTEKNIKLLKNKLLAEELTIVLGTGVSSSYGALSWNNLVNYMYKCTDSCKFDNENIAFSKIGNDNLSKVQYIKLELLKDSSVYAEILYSGLYNKFDLKNDYSNTSLNAIANLLGKHKIRKIITYNYDNFLEITLKNKSIEFSHMIAKEDYLKRNLPIYHVHGYLPFEASKKEKTEWVKSIILSEDDYFKLYNNSNHWQVAIQLQSFKDDVCLFVGNSVTDYNEKRILNYTKQKFKNHYAIFVREKLSMQDIFKIDNYYLETCNIEIIWVDTIDEITCVIESLING